MLEHASPKTRPHTASEFVAVMETAMRCMDQLLAYRGKDRFVTYYYEPRGQEVLWRDSRSYGFATGAWSTFQEEVGPIADHYRVDVGFGGSRAKHVLLIDRQDRKAYFAELEQALKFLKRIADGERQQRPESDALVPDSSMEITHDTVTRLAHEIWERKGKPEGASVENWLEAEAELKHKRQAPPAESEPESSDGDGAGAA